MSWLVADEFDASSIGNDHRLNLGAGRVHADLLRGLMPQRRRIASLSASEVAPGWELGDKVHVMFQSTHLANSSLMRQLRQLFSRIEIHYYLHEPGTPFAKIKRGDGIVSAVGVYLTHFFDLRATDRFYVAHIGARDRAVAAYPLARLHDRCDILPLPFRDLWPEFDAGSANRAPKMQVLLLGRADERRCLDVFIAAARLASMQGLKYEFAILSASAPALPSWALSLPNLRLRVGRQYSDSEMTNELRRSRFVFNLFRITYTQSGVTPVALMHGVPVIARRWEHDKELERRGCLYLDQVPTASEFLDCLQAAGPHDPQALRAYYLRTFDASQIILPKQALS